MEQLEVIASARLDELQALQLLKKSIDILDSSQPKYSPDSESEESSHEQQSLQILPNTFKETSNDAKFIQITPAQQPVSRRHDPFQLEHLRKKLLREIIASKKAEHIRESQEKEIIETFYHIQTLSASDRISFEKVSTRLMERISPGFAEKPSLNISQPNQETTNRAQNESPMSSIVRLYSSFFEAIRQRKQASEIERISANSLCNKFSFVCLLLNWLIEVTRKMLRDFVTAYKSNPSNQPLSTLRRPQTSSSGLNHTTEFLESASSNSFSTSSTNFNNSLTITATTTNNNEGVKYMRLLAKHKRSCGTAGGTFNNSKSTSSSKHHTATAAAKYNLRSAAVQPPLNSNSYCQYYFDLTTTNSTSNNSQSTAWKQTRQQFLESQNQRIYKLIHGLPCSFTYTSNLANNGGCNTSSTINSQPNSFTKNNTIANQISNNNITINNSSNINSKKTTNMSNTTSLLTNNIFTSSSFQPTAAVAARMQSINLIASTTTPSTQFISFSNFSSQPPAKTQLSSSSQIQQQLHQSQSQQQPSTNQSPLLSQVNFAQITKDFTTNLQTQLHCEYKLYSDILSDIDFSHIQTTLRASKRLNTSTSSSFNPNWKHYSNWIETNYIELLRMQLVKNSYIRSTITSYNTDLLSKNNKKPIINPNSQPMNLFKTVTKPANVATPLNQNDSDSTSNAQNQSIIHMQSPHNTDIPSTQPSSTSTASSSSSSQITKPRTTSISAGSSRISQQQQQIQQNPLNFVPTNPTSHQTQSESNKHTRSVDVQLHFDDFDSQIQHSKTSQTNPSTSRNHPSSHEAQQKRKENSTSQETPSSVNTKKSKDLKQQFNNSSVLIVTASPPQQEKQDDNIISQNPPATKHNTSIPSSENAFDEFDGSAFDCFFEIPLNTWQYSMQVNNRRSKRMHTKSALKNLMHSTQESFTNRKQNQSTNITCLLEPETTQAAATAITSTITTTQSRIEQAAYSSSSSISDHQESTGISSTSSPALIDLLQAKTEGTTSGAAITSDEAIRIKGLSATGLRNQRFVKKQGHDAQIFIEQLLVQQPITNLNTQGKPTGTTTTLTSSHCEATRSHSLRPKSSTPNSGNTPFVAGTSIKTIGSATPNSLSAASAASPCPANGSAISSQSMRNIKNSNITDFGFYEFTNQQLTSLRRMHAQQQRAQQEDNPFICEGWKEFPPSSTIATSNQPNNMMNVSVSNALTNAVAAASQQTSMLNLLNRGNQSSRQTQSNQNRVKTDPPSFLRRNESEFNNSSSRHSLSKSSHRSKKSLREHKDISAKQLGTKAGSSSNATSSLKKHLNQAIASKTCSAGFSITIKSAQQTMTSSAVGINASATGTAVTATTTTTGAFKQSATPFSGTSILTSGSSHKFMKRDGYITPSILLPQIKGDELKVSLQS